MATRVWIGSAANITQRTAFNAVGTWTASDTIKLTINSKDLIITVGSETTTAKITEICAKAVNASSANTNLSLDESRNIGGQEIPEFTEITGTNSASIFTAVAKTAGFPFTLTQNSTTASTGSLTSGTSVVATGRNFYSNADNWSGGAVPVTSDKKVFQDSAVDCLYDIDQASSATNTTYQQDASYTGNIGLSARNPNGYDEYRPRHLELRPSSVANSVVIGEGPGSGSSRTNLSFGSTDPKVSIVNTAPAEVGAKAAVDLIGGNTAMDVSVRRGSVSLSAISTNACAVRTLDMTFENQQATDANVTVGDNATISEVDKSGGSLTFINTPALSTVSTLTNREGLVEFNGAGTCSAMTIEGGEVRWNSVGILGPVILTGAGHLDFSRDNRPKPTVATIERFSDTSRVSDPSKVVTSLVIDNNQTSNLSRLELGSDVRITRGTPS